MTAYQPKGRSTPRIKVPQADGTHVTRSVGSTDPEVRADVQAMVRDLRRRRRWDVLGTDGTDGVIGGKRAPLVKLCDAWRRGEAALDHYVTRLLATQHSVDLEPYVAKWSAWLRTRKGTDTQTRYPAQVRTLLPAGVPFPQTELTPERVEAWLSGLVTPRRGKKGTTHGRPAAPGTVRRYHAALASFVGYLVTLKVLPANPVEGVTAPPPDSPRCTFPTPEELRDLLDRAAEPTRSLFALMYGAGIEVSVALALKRRDVNLEAREIHARGTKRVRGRENHRDRWVRVAEWAWPFVVALCKTRTPDALLFAGVGDRHRVTKYHKALATEVGRGELRLHDSRHYFAVRLVRSGTPVEVVADQLGHADATMVVKVYGRFRPTAQDREKWERIAALQDDKQKASPGHG